nr:MAG TPA: zinc-ribbon domain protein [Caudoviricetes sp.]
MDEYIKRETAVRAVMAAKWVDGSDGAMAMEIVASPAAADVAPVVHGRWIRPHWKNNNYCCDCSECGGEAMHRDYQWDKNGVYPICPNCGAKMDGGAE